MELFLKCLQPNEFKKLRSVLEKYTRIYQGREESWINNIVGRLEDGSIKKFEQGDLKRMIYIVDMWNFSNIGEIDSEIEKIGRKLKKFYFETQERELR